MHLSKHCFHTSIWQCVSQQQQQFSFFVPHELLCCAAREQSWTSRVLSAKVYWKLAVKRLILQDIPLWFQKVYFHDVQGKICFWLKIVCFTKCTKEPASVSCWHFLDVNIKRHNLNKT